MFSRNRKRKYVLSKKSTRPELTGGGGSFLHKMHPSSAALILDEGVESFPRKNKSIYRQPRRLLPDNVSNLKTVNHACSHRHVEGGTCCTLPRPILKKTESKIHSFNSTQLQLDKHKKTSFNKHVDVVYYDEFDLDGKSGGGVMCTKDCLMLKGDDDDGPVCVGTHQSVNGLKYNVHKPREPTTTSCIHEQIVHKMAESQGSAAVTCIPHKFQIIADVSSRNKARQLRIIIKLHQHCAKNKVSVRVLSGGHRLILTSPIIELDVGGMSVESHKVDTIQLPVKVDAYHMKAFLKATGKLIVEAPIRIDNVKAQETRVTHSKL